MVGGISEVVIGSAGSRYVAQMWRRSSTRLVRPAAYPLMTCAIVAPSPQAQLYQRVQVLPIVIIIIIIIATGRREFRVYE